MSKKISRTTPRRSRPVSCRALAVVAARRAFAVEPLGDAGEASHLLHIGAFGLACQLECLAAVLARLADDVGDVPRLVLRRQPQSAKSAADDGKLDLVERRSVREPRFDVRGLSVA